MKGEINSGDCCIFWWQTHLFEDNMIKVLGNSFRKFGFKFNIARNSQIFQFWAKILNSRLPNVVQGVSDEAWTNPPTVEI